MAQELHFIDPAFRCEVVLSGTAKALYDAAEPQFDRLKGIRSLGLGAHLHEVARHTRHEHAIGLMRIFNKLCQQPKEKGLPKAFLWSFWPRLCFVQTGHAAMSYDSEKAVLLACHLHSGFKARLRSLLQPAIDKVAACQTCTRQCTVRDKDKNEADQWFEEMISRNQWRRLHLWIAALKLVQEAKVLQILAGQQASQGNLLGFSEAEAFKMLVAPKCTWERPLRNLIRLDYIVRDLAFAGTLGVQLDVDSLVAAANTDHPDWGLLARLDNYMSETLYESLEAQTASVLFQRVLAAMLIKRKVSLEMLFGIESDQALSDDELCAMMRKTVAGSKVLDPVGRRSWRAWRINTFIEPSLSPCDVERKITGYRKGYLSQHSSTRATCFKMRQNHWLALAISHQSLADRPAAKFFVKLCRSVLKNQYPQLTPDHLTDALFEGLLNRRCSHGLDAVVQTLSKLSVQHDALRKAADVVNKRASGRVKPSGAFSYKIGDYEYPAHGDPWNLQVNVMHAALSGGDSVREKLDVTVEDAAGILWSELLRWQTEYFGLRSSKKVLDLLTKAQEVLAKRVIQGTDTAASDLELYTLLEALRHPDAGVSFRIALPNLKLIKGDDQPENEYDVVSVSLKEDKHVEVWAWGVTTEANLDAKRTADLGKIQKLRDLLGSRWGDEVRVVTCYVHKEGADVVLDIDGRQSRREAQ
jgi:hypothetical protein